MGFKLVWRMLMGKGSWWVEALKRKYLNGLHSNVLIEVIVERPCTPVWKLIKKFLPQIKNHISKSPRNGKEINIWTDRIMGSEPRNLLQQFNTLKLWMEAKNLHSLFDISVWKHNSWLAWRDLPLSNNLRKQWADLKISLTGSAPLNKEPRDSFIWDPSGGHFTVKDGYKLLQSSPNLGNWNLRSVVWNTECLPKIKFFAWTLLKGKILTAENLKKRGTHGPSICCLYCAEEESSQHLFSDCPFAQNCWKQIISPLRPRETFDQLSILNRNWEKSYPHTRKGKTTITRLWKCIPSALSWQIWITRNNCIFNNEKPNPGRTLAKTMGLVAEMISANSVSQPDRSSWMKEEQEWFDKFQLNYVKNMQPPPIAGKRGNNWKLMGSQEDIDQWIQEQKKNSLQFNGASKSNLGQAGAGGIIKDQNGQVIITYEWGLGNMTNNMAEAYNLLLGVNIMRKLQVKNPIIIGDSAIMIAAMASGGEFKKQALNCIKHRVKENSNQMGDILYKHVMRNNNAKADSLANRAVNRPTGQVRENDLIYDKTIP